MSNIKLGTDRGYTLSSPAAEEEVEVLEGWTMMGMGNDYIVVAFDDMYIYDSVEDVWINHKEIVGLEEVIPISPTLSLLVDGKNISIDINDGTETITPSNISAERHTHEGYVIALDRICTEYISQPNTTILMFNDVLEPGEVIDYDKIEE